jgi:uncharacterized integral membrane protein
MNNEEFATRSNNPTVDNSRITKNQKIILGILLVILCLLLIVIGQKVLKTLEPVMNFWRW